MFKHLEDKPYVYGRVIKPYHLPTARARRAVKDETGPRASRDPRVPAPITHEGKASIIHDVRRRRASRVPERAAIQAEGEAPQYRPTVAATTHLRAGTHSIKPGTQTHSKSNRTRNSQSQQVCTVCDARATRVGWAALKKMPSPKCKEETPASESWACPFIVLERRTRRVQ